MSFDAPDTPEPKRSGHHWFDLLISICALITSGLSMYVAYNNDQSLERLVHANSWPFLQLNSGNAGADGASQVIEFAVQNAGTGPARIYSFEFLVDGRPVSNQNLFVNLSRACCGADYRNAVNNAAPNAVPNDIFDPVLTAPAAPGILAANDQMSPLTWPHTARNNALWNAVDQARQQGRITMRSCYCSVFDECWVAQTDTLPQPLHGVCPMPRRQHHQ